MPQKPMHPTAVQHATAAACAGGHHLECMATRTPTLNKVSLATQTEAHERARPTRAVRWDHKVVLKQCSKNPYTRITPRLALTSILLFYNFICRFIRQLFCFFSFFHNDATLSFFRFSPPWTISRTCYQTRNTSFFGSQSQVSLFCKPYSSLFILSRVMCRLVEKRTAM